MKIYAWLTIAMLSLATSCPNKDEPCTNAGASIDITGFDSTEINRVTTYKYPPDGHFASILDSTWVELRYGFQKGDTLFHSGLLESGFDYIVATSPAMKTWRITNFNLYPAIRKGYEHARCGIATYTVDDTPYSNLDLYNQETSIVLIR